MVREVLFSLGCAALADWIQKLLTLAHARNRNQGAQAIAITGRIASRGRALYIDQQV